MNDIFPAEPFAPSVVRLFVALSLFTVGVVAGAVATAYALIW